MITNHPRIAAVGAFLAGGVIVGAVTLATGVAHGTTTPLPGLKQSSAEFTARYAWARSIPAGTTPTAPATLSVPTGDRLTITFMSGYNAQCHVNAVVNGASASYDLNGQIDGTQVSNTVVQTTFVPVYADSGTVYCGGSSPTLVGYLTPTN
jgi:hypothetical protein